MFSQETTDEMDVEEAQQILFDINHNGVSNHPCMKNMIFFSSRYVSGYTTAGGIGF